MKEILSTVRELELLESEIVYLQMHVDFERHKTLQVYRDRLENKHQLKGMLLNKLASECETEMSKIK